MGYDKIGLGIKIFTSRKQKKLTQSEVCCSLGINQSAYSKIENGNYDLTLSLLIDIAIALDISIAWLLGIDKVEFTKEEQEEIEKFKKHIISIRNK